MVFSHAGIIALSVFWSRLRYLNKYWMDCHEMLYKYPRCPENLFGDLLTFLFLTVGVPVGLLGVHVMGWASVEGTEGRFWDTKCAAFRRCPGPNSAKFP